MAAARAESITRVVTVSSLTHWLGRIDFDDLGGEQRYRPMGRYEMSKLANLMFTFELASRAEKIEARFGDRLPSRSIQHRPCPESPILTALFVPMAYVLNTARQGALPTLRRRPMHANSGDYFGPEGLFSCPRRQVRWVSQLPRSCFEKKTVEVSEGSRPQTSS